jgi:hypothetical protein
VVLFEENVYQVGCFHCHMLLALYVETVDGVHILFESHNSISRKLSSTQYNYFKKKKILLPEEPFFVFLDIDKTAEVTLKSLF